MIPVTEKRVPPHVKYGKHSNTATASEAQALPFHCKAVGVIDIRKLRELALGTPFASRLNEVLLWLHDESKYSPMSDKEIDAWPATTLLDSDIRKYIDVGQVRLVPRKFVLGTVNAFSVKEDKLITDPQTPLFISGDTLPPHTSVESRRRGIQEPKRSNTDMKTVDALSYKCEMTLTKLSEQLSQVRTGDWATCGDISMSFSNHRLNESVQRFFCFKDTNGQWYASTVMVMGHRPSAEIMELTTAVLAHARLNASDVRVVTHIDNVRYLHNDRAVVARCMQQFLDNAAYVGATVNDDVLHKPHRVGMSFGVVHDYEQGVCALSEKTLRKLVQCQRDFFGRITLRRAFEIMGQLFYASTVLRVTLAPFYFVVKWYRRLAAAFERAQRGDGDMSLTSDVQLWKSVRPAATKWFTVLLANVPVAHHVPDPTVTIFTDASKYGWGGVLFEGTSSDFHEFGDKFSPTEVGEPWSENDAPKRIHCLEAKAVAKTLKRFRHTIAGKSVRVYIDNTSVLGALRKTHSASFELNAEIQDIIDTMPGAKFTFEYVASQDNFADARSRGRSRA